MASTAEETGRIGHSLAHSISSFPLTIFLSGEPGAGKTTFVQGLGLGLGLEERITSPTFALENRYGEQLLHIDLYRLDGKEAARFLEESEEFPGVRAVEWSDRIHDDTAAAEDRDLPLRGQPSIHILITDPTPVTREITITFRDIPLPDRRQIEQWREEMRLPDHLGKHCDTVGAFAEQCARSLLERGTVARPKTLNIAGQLHDLLRFVDFRPDVQAKIPHAQKADAETQAHWDDLRQRHPGSHEEACYAFLSGKGYRSLGEIIRRHGLHTIVHAPDELKTTEQKILFYADKRVLYDRIVSLDERFDDFAHRYGDGKESEFAKMARERTKEIEEGLGLGF